ncbi:MAG TPA: sigma-70 family RNA polymerase sigma factor [Prolixibacteraceae bacterium]|nr:sigma-70 family RNA polymerase sigma factor [Prolixibacteraceae bacterium]HPS11651.1 sigma-70 family RNA polymerase sigma factor [Prolixibacteraceae bacterium]
MTREEFKELFDIYFADLRKYIFYRSGDENLATDIAQDTFLRIWEKQISIDHKTIKSLLFKIGNDLFITRYRKEKVAFRFFKTYKPDEHDLSPEEQLNYNELKIAYEKSLETMPEKQRVVFLMSRIDNLKYAEIADQLGLSVKAVEKRMNLALTHLKTHLKDKTTGIILFLAGLRSSFSTPNIKQSDE